MISQFLPKPRSNIDSRCIFIPLLIPNQSYFSPFLSDDTDGDKKKKKKKDKKTKTPPSSITTTKSAWETTKVTPQSSHSSIRPTAANTSSTLRAPNAANLMNFNDNPPPPPSTTPPSSRSTPIGSRPPMSMDESDSSGLPPPRPAKSGELTYANLDRRSFMHDPRNQVLPSSSAFDRSNATQYASVRKVVTTTSTVSNSKVV